MQEPQRLEIIGNHVATESKEQGAKEELQESPTSPRRSAAGPRASTAQTDEEEVAEVVRKNGKELETAAGTAAGDATNEQEKEEMVSDEENARVLRAREEGDEGAKADAKAAKKGKGGVKRRGQGQGQ